MKPIDQTRNSHTELPLQTHLYFSISGQSLCVSPRWIETSVEVLVEARILSLWFLYAAPVQQDFYAKRVWSRCDGWSYTINAVYVCLRVTHIQDISSYILMKNDFLIWVSITVHLRALSQHSLLSQDVVHGRDSLIPATNKYSRYTSLNHTIYIRGDECTDEISHGVITLTT